MSEFEEESLVWYEQKSKQLVDLCLLLCKLMGASRSEFNVRI